MKKVIVIGGLIVLGFVVLAVVMTRQTFMLESVADAQALWNDDKLLVVVQKRVAVLRTYWLLHKLARVSGISFPLPHTFPEDLIIIQVQNGENHKQEYPSVGRMGNAFPYSGVVYFLRGSDTNDYPALHQLADGKLVRVPREEAESIVRTFQLESELVKREGWQKRDLYFTEGQSVYPIRQGSKETKLVLTQTRKTGTVKIELADEQTKAGSTLFELSNHRREITEDEFRKLVGTK